jgi:hypothetical protein
VEIAAVAAANPAHPAAVPARGRVEQKESCYHLFIQDLTWDKDTASIYHHY